MKPILRGASFGIGVLAAMVAGWFAFPRALYRSEPQPLRFSHAVHTGEKAGMSCDACHPIHEDGSFGGIPPISKCAECHQSPIGGSSEEKRLIDEFIAPAREIPWKGNWRQPDHVYFAHATHVKLARLSCAECHGAYGDRDAPPAYEQNRLTGYSRTLWGHSLSRFGMQPWEGKKMTDCSGCHRDRGVEESCLDCHK